VLDVLVDRVVEMGIGNFLGRGKRAVKAMKGVRRAEWEIKKESVPPTDDGKVVISS